MNKKIIFITGIVTLVILSGLAFYYFNQYHRAEPLEENPKEEIVQQITMLTFMDESLTEELKQKYRRIFDPQAEVFLNNPEGAEAYWPVIKIGQVKQLAGDYDGALQAFFWARELQPKSYVANGNIAHLYFRQYQDFAKAEEYYLKAIEPDGMQTVNYYLDLHEIYRYFYKTDTNLVEDILKQGIERLPEETDLMAILAHYYKSLERYDEARTYYQMMLEVNPDSQVAKEGLLSL